MKTAIKSSVWLSLFTSLIVTSTALAEVPSITAFHPLAGPAGTSVTIAGNHFNPSPSNNIVYFGPVRGAVTAASVSNLTVTVPNGAMFAPITVTVGGLVAYSLKPFEPTFAGNGADLDASTFASRLDIPMPSGPTRIAVADLNGDGKPDLIIASMYAHELTVLQNVSTSGSIDTNSFVSAATISVPNNQDNPYWVTAGDVDGDGKIDLLVPDSAGQVLVYRNISSGGLITSNSFAAPVAFAAGNTPRNILLRDLDGDGRPDIAVANVGDETVSILKNIGTAGVIDTNSFAPQFVMPAGALPHDLTAGDLDGDGKPDLAVNAYSSPFISIYRNISSPGILDTNSFAARVDLPAPIGCNSIVMGDLDGDGKLDLVIGTAEGNNKVSVYRNLSSPGVISSNSFSPEIDFPAAGWVSTVALGDLNGDGKLDIAIVNQMGSTLSLFQNIGTNAFSSASLSSRIDYPSGANPYGVSIVDLDGDGRPDLVLANAYSDSLSIYRNDIGNAGEPMPPVITEQPTNQTVAAGGTANFSVTATGTPPLTYQWWNITGSIFGATNSTLTLSNVQPAQAGRYYVVVNGPGGTTTSSNAVLTVTGGITNTPPVITHQPTNQTVSVGGTATFSVTATGSPTLHYQWYGPSNALIPGAISSILTLSNVQPSNAGNYFVLVSNLFGFANSSNAVLTASGGGTSNMGPVITRQPTNQTVQVGGTATFFILFTGPNVTYWVQWYHDGNPVHGEPLIISNAQPSDAGSYFCVVSNQYGFAQSSNAVLTVTGTTTNGECTPPASGMAGWWRAEGNALDSADGNNGTLVNGVGFTTGEVGHGFLFTQTNQNVKIPYNSNLDVGLGAGLTLEAWIKPNDPGTYNPIFEWNADDGVSYFGVHFYALSTDRYSNYQPGTLYADIQDVADGWHQLWSPGGIITSNQFQHVALTYDKSSGVATLYCNGAIVAQATLGTFAPKTTGYLNIGARVTDPANEHFTFAGVIDEPTVYNRALSSNEIAAIYGAGSAGKCSGTTGTAPLITKQPTNQTAAVGGKAIFSVTATGTPPLAYQWWHGPGTPGWIPTMKLTNATSATLTLSNVQSFDAGAYFVTVTDPYGSVRSSNAVLAVTGSPSNPPPFIVQQPTNQTAPIGGLTLFSVVATSSVPLYYQWYGPNGAFIPGANSATLVLSNVQPSSSGSYFASVWNVYGTIHSSNAVLTVTGTTTSGDCTPPPSGLVGWWKGDTNTLDSAGANNGYDTNGTVSYTAGEVGVAFHYDANGGYVEIPASSSLNVGLGSGFTLEGWIEPADLVDQMPLFEWQFDNVDKVHFWVSVPGGSGAGSLYANVMDTNDNPHLIFSAPGILTSNYQHVAVTYDKASGIATLYRNGNIVAQSGLGSFTPNTTGNLLLGERTDSSKNPLIHYLGNLDEMSVYGRALSSNEIAAIYNAGAAGKCTSNSSSNTAPLITHQPTNQTAAVGGSATFSVTAMGSPTLHYQWYGPSSALIPGANSSSLIFSNVQPANAGAYFAVVTNLYGFAVSSNAVLTVTGITNSSCTPPPSGIVAWWPGEGNGLDIVNSNNLTQENVTFGPGEVGQAFQLNGTNNSYLWAWASPSLNVGFSGNGFTIEGWIKVASVNSYWQPIAQWQDGSGNAGVELTISSNRLYALIVGMNGSQPGMQSGPGTILPGVFQHVAMTYDPAAGMGNLYINGANVASVNAGQLVPQTSYPFMIGNGLNGSVDELSLYDRALSSNEIASIYNAGAAGKCTSTAASSNLPPVITHQPTNQTVSIGGVAHFSVTATGTPPLNYQWYTSKSPATLTIKLLNATNALLTLSNVQSSIAGNYFVVVTNSYGYAYSSNAVLTVTSTTNNDNCTPPPAGMVGWWRAEGNALDSAGTNNGILANGLGFTTGEVGQGFSFTHTNQNVKIPYNSNLDVGLGAGLTLEAWINPSDTATNFNPIFEWNADDGLSNFGVHFYVLPAGGGSPLGTLYANVQGVGDVWHQISSAGIVTNNEFQHVALTYDKSSGVATLYRDGAIVAQTMFGSFTPKTTGYLNIGARVTDPANEHYTFAGVIDEPTVYNRALGSNEIAAIYNAGANGKCTGSTSSNLPPKITIQPTDFFEPVGGSAKFSIVATGSPTLHYQWYGPSNTFIPGANSSTMTVSNIQPSNAGPYFVVVTNLYGSTTSSNGFLTVSTLATKVQVIGTNAVSGSTVVVPINLVPLGNENALSFSLNFDPTRLSYSGVALGSGGSNAMILPNVSQVISGKLGIELALPSGEAFGLGTRELVRVSFTSAVLTGAQSVVTAVTFTNQPTAELVSDAVGNSLPALWYNGSVTLSPTAMEGDAAPLPSGNGTLDLFDWVQVGRYVAGLDPITNGAVFQKVDCAPRGTLGDGQITVADWVQAGRYAAGLDPLTAAGGPTGPVVSNSIAAFWQPLALTARQLSIRSGAVVKDLTVTLPITLQAQGDESALGFSLSFDPTLLQYVNTVRSSAAGSALYVNASQAASGRLGIVISLPAGSQFPAGLDQIAQVTFLATGTAANDSVTFADQPVVRSISDANATELPSAYISSSVIINPHPNVALSHGIGTSALSWPVWAGDFQLQAAGSLLPPINWTNVPMTLQTNGDQIQVILPAPDGQTFFRLHHP